jgi:hypothetical protein
VTPQAVLQRTQHLALIFKRVGVIDLKMESEHSNRSH